ncbi:hypothetical protein AKJ16_DCAP04898 [Drosera capensis]
MRGITKPYALAIDHENSISCEYICDPSIFPGPLYNLPPAVELEKHGRPSSLKQKNGEETRPVSKDPKRTRRIPTQLGPTAEPHSGPNNGNKQNEAGQGGYGNDKVDPSRGKGVDSLSLSDPAVFDCNHCLKPLTVPVYQNSASHPDISDSESSSEIRRTKGEPGSPAVGTVH